MVKWVCYICVYCSLCVLRWQRSTHVQWTWHPCAAMMEIHMPTSAHCVWSDCRSRTRTYTQTARINYISNAPGNSSFIDVTFINQTWYIHSYRMYLLLIYCIICLYYAKPLIIRHQLFFIFGQFFYGCDLSLTWL